MVDPVEEEEQELIKIRSKFQNALREFWVEALIPLLMWLRRSVELENNKYIPDHNYQKKLMVCYDLWEWTLLFLTFFNLYVLNNIFFKFFISFQCSSKKIMSDLGKQQKIVVKINALKSGG